MSESDLGTSGTDPLPDRLKQYLSETAKRELDALRAQLEVKLIALETALARPNDFDSIEHFVIDLARVATAEAEASAARASLDVRLQAEERSGVAEARRAVDEERSAKEQAVAALTTIKRELAEL